MSVVYEAIKNGIGQRRIADILMPVIDGYLRGHDGGTVGVAILKEFEQIAALPGGTYRDTRNTAIFDNTVKQDLNHE